MVVKCRILVFCVLLAATPDALAAGRNALQRDVEGYAVAVCLSAQDNQPYLKDQGYVWAEVIVQGRGRDIEALAPVRTAVLTALSKGDMPGARDEAHPMQAKPLPVLYCAEIIDKPEVRAAITKVIAKISKGH